MDDIPPPSILNPSADSTTTTTTTNNNNNNNNNLHNTEPHETFSPENAKPSSFLSATAASFLAYDTWQFSTRICVTLVIAFIGYVLLCRVLRFRSIRSIERRLGYSSADRGSLARMSNEDAHILLKHMLAKEFPMTFNLALQFALFKTYGIETISKLLVATKNLSDPDKSSKRYEDTTILFGEFMLSHPTSERALKAIARMNYLHAPYQAAGQISNKDLLYTLAVCVMEPIRFIQLYEWRGPTDVEKCAMGTFWKAIGDAMGIQYGGLLERAGHWRDGLDFAEDITAWAKTFECEAIKPAKTNAAVSKESVRLMLWYVPSMATAFAEEILSVLMGDRVREAFFMPEPRLLPSIITLVGLVVRRFVVRHLCLPRVVPKTYFSEPHPETGRIQHYEYFVKPYYNPPTLWTRVGPGAWFTWLVGGDLPGSDGLMSEGFLFEEIGPNEKVGKGVGEMEHDLEFMKGLGRGGCPFSRSQGDAREK